MDKPFTVSSNSLLGFTHTFILIRDQADAQRAFREPPDDNKNSNDVPLYDCFRTMRWVIPRPIPFIDDNNGLQPDSLCANVDHVGKELHREARSLNGQWNRIVLCGLGTGATIAVKLALDSPSPVNAVIIAPSGSSASIDVADIPGPSASDGATENLNLANVPVLFPIYTDVTHSERDHSLHELLSNLRASVSRKQLPADKHWLNCVEGVDAIQEFLDRVLYLDITD